MPTASPGPTATPVPTAEPPTPAPTQDPATFPSRWTGISWTAGPNSDELAELAAKPQSIGFQIFGWSHGYLGFRSVEIPAATAGGHPSVSIVVESSLDGLQWSRGASLTPPADYALQASTGYPLEVTDLIEGPAGLVAVGRVMVPILGGHQVAAMWTSADGHTWHSLDVMAAFGSRPWFVGGGSVGYIATGSPMRDAQALVWVSSDARKWVRHDAPKAGSGAVETRSATAFRGGYVLATEAAVEPPGPDWLTLTPSLWWSVDGQDPIHVTLPGATRSILQANVLPQPDYEATLSLYRIGDDALLAVESSTDDQAWTSGSLAWTSTDGQHWTPLPGVDLSGDRILSNVNGAVVWPSSPGQSGRAVEVFGANRQLLVVPQSGVVPSGSPFFVALGPAGLLVVDSAKPRFIVGTPVVR